MDDKDITELLRAILVLCGRQMALLDLIRESGVPQEKIDKALHDAKTRLTKLDRVAHLSSGHPSNLQGLAALLESVR
jgi:hypothetical protein